MSTIALISSPNVPTPAGHYSHATTHNGVVYVSGLLPITLHGPLAAGASFDDQVTAVFDNLEEILEAARSDLRHVLRVTVYIADISLWPRFNELYTQRFGAHKPARTVVPVPVLHYGYLIEIDAISAVVV